MQVVNRRFGVIDIQDVVFHEICACVRSVKMFASIAKHAVFILVLTFCCDMVWPSLEVRVTLEELVTSDNILSFKFFSEVCQNSVLEEVLSLVQYI